MQAAYQTVFFAAVRAKLEKAKALGIKASWTTKDHLDALAEAIKAHPEQVRDVLGECYNVSAFQQLLAKTFVKTGDFQREAAKSPSTVVDELLKLAEG